MRFIAAIPVPGRHSTVSEGGEVAVENRRWDLRWMPPISVNVDDLDALPCVMRPVR